MLLETDVRTRWTRLSFTVDILACWAVRWGALLLKDFCAQLILALRCHPFPENQRKSPVQASVDSPEHICLQEVWSLFACRNRHVRFRKSYFIAPFPSNSPPPLPPPLLLLWNPSPRCDFLCFLWLRICRFPITRSGCLLEKPKNSNFLGRHLIKFPKREEESPLWNTDRTS